LLLKFSILIVYEYALPTYRWVSILFQDFAVTVSTAGISCC